MTMQSFSNLEEDRKKGQMSPIKSTVCVLIYK